MGVAGRGAWCADGEIAPPNDLTADGVDLHPDNGVVLTGQHRDGAVEAPQRLAQHTLAVDWARACEKNGTREGRVHLGAHCEIHRRALPRRHRVVLRLTGGHLWVDDRRVVKDHHWFLHGVFIRRWSLAEGADARHGEPVALPSHKRPHHNGWAVAVGVEGTLVTSPQDAITTILHTALVPDDLHEEVAHKVHAVVDGELECYLLLGGALLSFLRAAVVYDHRLSWQGRHPVRDERRIPGPNVLEHLRGGAMAPRRLARQFSGSAR
mmetsp:Transcript_551/g.1524  ORF Transcript_551/g.1524 Transcript_551/m.1524 type:complete len:266 (+) Transcript_551:1118-1915(+)